MPAERLRLRDLERCFLGVVPAAIATCSPDGVPNMTFLSIVHLVDEAHLALSFQFFNKTHENLRANPRAQVLVPDWATLQQYRIDARYVRTEREGPIFERMRTNLDAVASQMGLQGVFRLQGADVFEVLGVELLPHDLDLSPPEGPPDMLAGLETLSGRLAACHDLEALLDTTTAGLAELFDYQHTMILFVDEAGERLYTVASRGFAPSGVGGEVAVGEGLIGSAASERRAVRVGHMLFEQTLGEAVRATAREQGEPIEAREIPMPGLPDMRSQIAVPMLARERVLGVLCVQSAQQARFAMSDERILGTLARYLATAIQLSGHEPSDLPLPAATPAAAPGHPLKIRHHASDDSVFLDDAYLIKGLSGRIFARLLGVHRREGRVDFSNRELRLDRSLQLSPYRDNLETRLLLLRRRLDERAAGIHLVSTARGRFRLELERPFELAEAD
jgi:adenylate cyclase